MKNITTDLKIFNRFKEELKEYQKTNTKILCHAGLEALLEEFLNQEHSIGTGTYCLGFVMDTYENGVQATLKTIADLYSDASDNQRIITEDILALIKIARSEYELSKEELELFIQFFRNLTIIPVTEENAMWIDISDEDTLYGDLVKAYQSDRSPKIFKEVLGDGTVRYKAMDTKAFSDDGGFTWYTDCNSNSYVDLPYLPTEPEYIYLDRNGQPTKDEELIKEMYLEAEKETKEMDAEFQRQKELSSKVMEQIDLADLSENGDRTVLVAIDGEGNVVHVDNGDELQGLAEGILATLLSKEDEE